MIRILMFASTLLLIAYGLQAQQKAPQLVFDKTVYDFGQIREDKGKVSHQFQFTNTGAQPLIINEVVTQCGCTTPSYTKQPIMPGKKGYVGVAFDPRNRPGNFTKSILVRTNASNGTVLLRVKGNVVPKKRTLADKYPRKMGDLRLKSHHLAFVKVKHNQVAYDSLAIANDSGEPVSVSFTGIPEHIELYTPSKVLEPGAESYIYGKYDPSKVDAWGFRVDRVKVLINGKQVSNNTLVVSARIEEDFSHLSPEEKANAPKVAFEKTTHNFGTAKQNSQVTHAFHFKNTGKSDLIIRDIKSSCGCTTVKPDKNVISPGGSSSIKAIFHTGNREGHQDKIIYFISNDPENNNLKLHIKGEVKP